MSELIGGHASSLRKFLTLLNENRNMKICDGQFGHRILGRIHLSGNEERAFADEEIHKVLSDYNYFKEYFIKKGLWIFHPNSKE